MYELRHFVSLESQRPEGRGSLLKRRATGWLPRAVGRGSPGCRLLVRRCRRASASRLPRCSRAQAGRVGMESTARANCAGTPKSPAATTSRSFSSKMCPTRCRVLRASRTLSRCRLPVFCSRVPARPLRRSTGAAGSHECTSTSAPVDRALVHY